MASKIIVVIKYIIIKCIIGKDFFLYINNT